MNRRIIVVAVVLLLAGGGWLYQQQQTRAEAVVPPASAESPAAVPAPEAEKPADSTPPVSNDELTFTESELSAHCQSRAQGARSTLSERLDQWVTKQLEPVSPELVQERARYRFENTAPDQSPTIIAPPWDGYDDATLQQLAAQGNVQAAALLGLRLHFAARNSQLKREQKDALQRQAARLLDQAIRGGEHELLLIWGEAWTPLADVDESQVPAPNSRAHFDRRKNDSDLAQANIDAVRELARERGPFILRMQALIYSMRSLPFEPMLARGDEQAVQARKAILLRDYSEVWQASLSNTEQDVVKRIERVIATQRKLLEADARCEVTPAK